MYPGKSRGAINKKRTSIKLEGNFNTLEHSEQLRIVLNHPDNVKPKSQSLIRAFDMRSKIINK